jgi:hypothetical protein
MAMNWKMFGRGMEGIGILFTFVVGMTTLYFTRENDQGLRRLKEEQGQAKQALEEVRYLNEYNLSVYKEVVEALKTNNARQQQVVTALVEAMPADSPLRASLLKAISVGTTSVETRNLALYVAEEPSATAVERHDGSWNVDVFWCEGLPDGEKNARALADALEQQATLGVRHVRARMLPRGVNDRAGYQVTGLQIRHEEDEETAARKCKQAVESILKEKGLAANPDIDLRPVVNPTPGYISVFLCGSP